MERTHAYVGFFRRGFPGLGLELGDPATYDVEVGLKNRVPGIPVGENCMILRSLVLTHYQRVTNRHAARS